MRSNFRGFVLLVTTMIILVCLIRIANAQEVGIKPIPIPKTAPSSSHIFFMKDGRQVPQPSWQLQMVVRTPGDIQLISLRDYHTGDLCRARLSTYRPTTYDDVVIYFQCVAPDPKHPYE